MASDFQEVSFEIEDAACQLAIEGVPAAGQDSIRAAIEKAEKDTGPDGTGLCRVRCSSADAHEMRQYFERVAAMLQVRGEYDRSTVCAQTAERISRALDGRPRS
jgi:hypothetical protein